jgi:hypothetical protein
MHFAPFAENHRLRARVPPRNEDPPLELACSICGGNAIPAPPGSTKRTRFSCRWCCSRIKRRRDEVRIRRGIEISDLEVCDSQTAPCAPWGKNPLRAVVPSHALSTAP